MISSPNSCLFLDVEVNTGLQRRWVSWPSNQMSMSLCHVFMYLYHVLCELCSSVFCASPGCNLSNKVRKPNIMHITISIEASLRCFCLSSKTQIYSIYTEINVLDQWLWCLTNYQTHWRDAESSNREQSGCLFFFFFFRLHPCCISAFFPQLHSVFWRECSQ